MAEIFQTSRRVEFRDTDAAGIVHFSVFFAYMEQAEHELLRHLGLSVVSEMNGKTISWPRVSATCDYRRAIRFEQEVTIHVWVQRLGNTSATYGFKFQLDDETVAEGHVTSVCCQIESGQRPIPVNIPDAFVEKLRPYVDKSSDGGGR